MEELPLIIGHTYEAKRPARAGYAHQPLVNDRQIVWVGIAEVQYDGPAVRDGSTYPRVTHAAFRKWAGRDITAEMPKGEWRSWEGR